MEPCDDYEVLNDYASCVETDAEMRSLDARERAGMYDDVDPDVDRYAEGEDK